MKNKARKAVSAAIICAPCLSYAQSSVTLYGTLDNSIQYVRTTSAGSSQLTLQSGQLIGSNWGMRGSEDLGGGMKAFFRLESGFDLNSGKSAGSLFGRHAYVGIETPTFGSLTFGRQYDSVMYATFPVQPNNFLYYFTTPGDVDNSDGNMRSNGTVQWASPTFNGLTLRAMYSFGGIAGSAGSGQTYAASFGYEQGPLRIAGGYLHADNGNGVTATRGATTAASLFFTPVNAAYASASKLNIARLATSYAIGPLTLGGYYSYSEYLADAKSSFTGAERYQSASIWTAWQVTPATLVQLGYVRLKSYGNSSAKYDQLTLAGSYSLSKRTDLYASVSYAHASGNNGLGPAQAVIADSYAPAGNASQEMGMLGIRHRF